ncbi:MAG TPA: outer membrane protein assembly factor BamE [Gammaproteobacteria bacterium]
MSKLRILLPAVFAAALAGCSADRIPGVYRIDVEQGNVVTREMVDQLQPGMTKQQVRFVMGTPMLVDTFHENRWEYAYRVQPGNGELVSQHITVHFDGDTLTRVTGQLPASGNAEGGPQTVAVTGTLPDERGLLRRVWDALTDWDGDD